MNTSTIEEAVNALAAAATSTLTPAELGMLGDRVRCAGRCERTMLPVELDGSGRCGHCRPANS